MEAARPSRHRVIDPLRPIARAFAYCLVALLSAVWITSATASLSRPLFDLGKPGVGDAILGLARLLELTPHGTLELALILVGLKLMLGSYLLVAMLVTVYQRLRRRNVSDAMLDVGLFLSALGSIAAAAPFALEGEALHMLIGELMLCLIASALAGFGRGAEQEARPLVRDEAQLAPSLP